MAETIWPPNIPDTLEETCIRFLVRNLSILGYYDAGDQQVVGNSSNNSHDESSSVDPAPKGEFHLHPGVFLPKAICDRLLEILEEETGPLTDDVFTIFSNSQATQLSRVDLRHSLISSRGIHTLKNQPIVELAMKCHWNCLPVINSLHKTLRSLRLEKDDSIDNLLSNGDVVYDVREGGSAGNENSGVDEMTNNCDLPVFPADDEDFQKLTLPNLRKLVLQDLNSRPRGSASSNFTLGTQAIEAMIRPLNRLTHLSLAMSKVRLEHMECLGTMTTLVSLNLSNIRIYDFSLVLKHLSGLKNLRHLDLSQGDEDIIPVIYNDSENYLSEIVQTFPALTSLDVSGTNLAGFEPPEYVSHRMDAVRTTNSKGEEEEEKRCPIPGLEGRHLEFLGLLGCAYAACSRSNIPATRVTGDANPAQVLLAVQVYLDNQWLLIKALNDLFNFFRFSSVPNHCKALEAILAAMKNFPFDSSVQIAGSASLFYIAKGDQKKSITQKHKRAMISLLLRAMVNHSMEQTMMRNSCLTLCHMNLPDDVMFCYERLVKELLRMLQYGYRDAFIHRLGIFLLNCLACQVEGKEKELVGKMGAVDTMLDIITRKLREDDCDDVLEVAWSTLWNVTDETPSNCQKFLDKNGMDAFVQCLQKFPEKPELLRNMMGLMGNIAEVDHLRSRLMKQEYVKIFSHLLESTSDGIEVSYNACGVLSHMCFDGPELWVLDSPSLSEVASRMEAAINRWPLRSKRNINYRSFQPILRLVNHFDTPQVQHWAVWALCNLTCVSPEKYCDLLEKEGGREILQQVLADPRPSKCIHDLVERTLKQLSNKEASANQNLSDADDNEHDEYIVDVQEGEETEEEEEEEVDDDEDEGVDDDGDNEGGEELEDDGDVNADVDDEAEEMELVRGFEHQHVQLDGEQMEEGGEDAAPMEGDVDDEFHDAVAY